MCVCFNSRFRAQCHAILHLEGLRQDSDVPVCAESYRRQDLSGYQLPPPPANPLHYAWLTEDSAAGRSSSRARGATHVLSIVGHHHQLHPTSFPPFPGGSLAPRGPPSVPDVGGALTRDARGGAEPLAGGWSGRRREPPPGKGGNVIGCR